MTSRWNFRGPEFRLGLMLFALSTSSVAVAQPQDGADANAAPSAGEGASTAAPKGDSDKADTAKSDAPKADATAKADASVKVGLGASKGDLEAKAETAADKPAQPPRSESTSSTDSGDSAAAEPAAATEPAKSISVEILPGSGYPAPKVRGIVGGSLWMTMHGHQFPYMAPETSKSGLRLAISGSVWVDTSYARLISGSLDTAKGQKRWENQGRAVVRFTPAYTTKEGWFVQGQVEAVANGDQTLNGTNLKGIDDLFVRAGKWNVFDVTIGRFQGWEVYHYGMGLDLNTFERRGAEVSGLLKPPQIYGVDKYWDRPNDGAGNYAAHVYVNDYLRFEALGQIGTANGGYNTRSIRPVAVFDVGFLKVKAGYEHGVTTQQTDEKLQHTSMNGFGGAIQFVADPYIEGGVNGAKGFVDVWNDKGLPAKPDSTTTWSVGGFLNGRVYGPLILGTGVNYTRWTNLEPNASPDTPELNGQTEYRTHLQAFGAIQYSVWDKLFFKFVGAHANFHYEDVIHYPSHSYTNKEWAGRFRVMYLF